MTTKQSNTAIGNEVLYTQQPTQTITWRNRLETIPVSQNPLPNNLKDYIRKNGENKFIRYFISKVLRSKILTFTNDELKQEARILMEVAMYSFDYKKVKKSKEEYNKPIHKIPKEDILTSVYKHFVTLVGFQVSEFLTTTASHIEKYGNETNLVEPEHTDQKDYENLDPRLSVHDDQKLIQIAKFFKTYYISLLFKEPTDLKELTIALAKLDDLTVIEFVCASFGYEYHIRNKINTLIEPYDDFELNTIMVRVHSFIESLPEQYTQKCPHSVQNYINKTRNTIKLLDILEASSKSPHHTHLKKLYQFMLDYSKVKTEKDHMAFVKKYEKDGSKYIKSIENYFGKKLEEYYL